MKTWIVSTLEETIQGEETFQGRKLYEEIRYFLHFDLRDVSPFGIRIRQKYLCGLVSFLIKP